MSVSSYKELQVWQKGIEIVETVYTLSRGFPSDERFGLTSQARRAAVSIPSNIAEGFARRSRVEYRQFCHVSLGSCAELETQMIIANKLGFITNDGLKTIQELLDHESRMLNNLISKLTDALVQNH